MPKRYLIQRDWEMKKVIIKTLKDFIFCMTPFERKWKRLNNSKIHLIIIGYSLYYRLSKAMLRN